MAAISLRFEGRDDRRGGDERRGAERRKSLWVVDGTGRGRPEQVRFVTVAATELVPFVPPVRRSDPGRRLSEPGERPAGRSTGRSALHDGVGFGFREATTRRLDLALDAGVPGRERRPRAIARVDAPVERRPAPPARSRRVSMESRAAWRGLRRLLPGVVSLAVLAGVWFGAGALRSTGVPAPGHSAAGSTLIAGSTYVAAPGDTLWGIAERLAPSADPRPLVLDMSAELHGAVLQPGDRIVLP